MQKRLKELPYILNNPLEFQKCEITAAHPTEAHRTLIKKCCQYKTVVEDNYTMVRLRIDPPRTKNENERGKY